MLVMIQKENDFLFCKLALKFTNNINSYNNSDIKSLALKSELKLSILLTVLDQFQIIVSSFLKNSIDKKNLDKNIDYILIIIFINSGINLTKKFPILFPKINYFSTESKWLLLSFLKSESYFVKDLLCYFIFSLKDKGNQTKKKVFLLILESIIIKITNILIHLYLFQKKSKYQILQNQINDYFDLESSIRNLQNHLYWDFYIQENFFKIKEIHQNIYSIKVITNNCVSSKKILYPRFEEKKKLSDWQNLILIYLEFADFIKLQCSYLQNNTHF